MEFTKPVSVMSIEKKGHEAKFEADENALKMIVDRFDLASAKFFRVSMKVVPQSDQMTYRVAGNFQAEIVQTCIVSGEEIEVSLSEEFEGWYRDQSRIISFSEGRNKVSADSNESEYEIRSEEEDPEPIENGVLDLAEVTMQFLGLSIDPYPKSMATGAGDYIETKPEDKPNPFAKLAELKTKE
jgi:uncharacterized metal-binding protein YceD (DUF177 family)